VSKRFHYVFCGIWIENNPGGNGWMDIVQSGQRIRSFPVYFVMKVIPTIIIEFMERVNRLNTGDQ